MKRTRNDIAMAYSIIQLPGPVAKSEFFEALLQFLDGDRVVLPSGWRVKWRWQNSKKQDWREDSFENTVSNSRDSFVTLMRRRLERDLEMIGGAVQPETDEDKLLAIEDILGEEFETLAEARKALREYNLHSTKRSSKRKGAKGKRRGKKKRPSRVSKVRKAKTSRRKPRRVR